VKTPTQQQSMETTTALMIMYIAAEEMVYVIPRMLEMRGKDRDRENDATHLQEAVEAIANATNIIAEIANDVMGDDKESKITWKDLTGEDV
jgi:hypothetical protein